MVESAKYRSSRATAATASVASRSASPSVAESGCWHGMRSSTKTVADSIGNRSAFGLFGGFPSTTEATFSRKDYTRETAE